MQRMGIQLQIGGSDDTSDAKGVEAAKKPQNINIRVSQPCYEICL